MASRFETSPKNSFSHNDHILLGCGFGQPLQTVQRIAHCLSARDN
jgi:hypothetical protein